MRENLTFLHNPLIHSGDFLEQFVHSQRFPTSIKDATTGKYLICNEALSNRDGIVLSEYVGLTAYDIGRAMHIKDSVLKNAVDMDKRIFSGILPYVQYNQVFPVYGGYISVEEVVKKPILNKSNTIIGLIAYACDITLYIDPVYLFSVYRQYHPTKKAIQLLLHAMKLHHVFHELPTKQELIVLLTMRKTASSKYVAKELKISPRTVDANKARLCDKLKVIPLSELLMRIRMRHELKNIDES